MRMHPSDKLGFPSLLMINDGVPTPLTKPTEHFCEVLPVWLDGTSYVSLNRFWGRRRNSSLAQLNAVYLDLDYHNRLEWRGKPASEVQEAFEDALTAAAIPVPSIYLHTGRGLAVIWLIKPLPPQALKRWDGAMRAAIKFALRFGADPACKDAARVFRLPGTINQKSGTEVRVSAATWKRHDFDELADRIYSAVGQPTKAELRASRLKSRKRKQLRGGGSMPKGLTAPQRFSLILQDLEDIKRHCGGRIPEGLRNIWLHLYSVCLTHCAPSSDIAAEIEAQADDATPGLPPSEVEGIIRSAERAVERGFGAKYHYGGQAIAAILSVSAAVAQQLGLKIVVPAEEGRRRATLAEERRRRARGAVSRDAYLARNNAEQEKPWIAANQSRATWYRHRAQEKAAAQQAEVVAEESPTDAPVRQVPCRNKGNLRLRVTERNEQNVSEGNSAPQPRLRKPTHLPMRHPDENRTKERQREERREGDPHEVSFLASPPVLRGRKETNPTRGSEASRSRSGTRSPHKKGPRRSCHRVIPLGVEPEDSNVLLRRPSSRSSA
ncbi:DNA-primase RepB domain-containing protein [Sulfitobacter sp.]|uniref:DNA-primase RepB domain-containing protein n=1 Tax=Sulfitobacter sp. TaxID=1903071 RepID=UPI003EFA6A18